MTFACRLLQLLSQCSFALAAEALRPAIPQSLRKMMANIALLRPLAERYVIMETHEMHERKLMPEVLCAVLFNLVRPIAKKKQYIKKTLARLHNVQHCGLRSIPVPPQDKDPGIPMFRFIMAPTIVSPSAQRPPTWGLP